jgi:hypothetical protein
MRLISSSRAALAEKPMAEATEASKTSFRRSNGHRLDRDIGRARSEVPGRRGSSGKGISVFSVKVWQRIVVKTVDVAALKKTEGLPLETLSC